jgi:hypothetical protein
MDCTRQSRNVKDTSQHFLSKSLMIAEEQS